MNQRKINKVYLVENAHGRILAVFRNLEDAGTFLELLDEPALLEPRTLWEGQPPVRGYND